MVVPEGYDELETYLNLLSAWLWKKILRAKDKKEVIQILRDNCGSDLHLWTDVELSEFFDDYPLSSFDSLDGRF